MRAETDDVAFRLLIALANVWDGVQRASIDTVQNGLHLTKNYSPTAGCIAVKKKDFEILLKIINKKTQIRVV